MKIIDPSSLITWAICAGLAWLIFAGITGADDWLRSHFGKASSHDLESRIADLEKRLDNLEKK